MIIEEYNLVIIVEEAKKLETHDLEQHEAIIKKLKNGDLLGVLETRYDLRFHDPKLIGILHGRGKIGIITRKLVVSLMRRLHVSIYIVNCNYELRNTLKDLVREKE